MARTKPSEQPRNRAKPNLVEELTRGIAKLRELSTHIDDLSRDGFPYGDAVRARTELSLRETIRRFFGEKSPEYQTHKNHKLRIGTRAESAQSIGLLKELIAALEQQKADLSGLKPDSSTPPEAVNDRTTLTTVPSRPPSDSISAPDTLNSPLPTAVPVPAPATVSVTTSGSLPHAVPPVTPATMTIRDSVPPAPVSPVASPPSPIHDTSLPRRPDPLRSSASDPTQAGATPLPLAGVAPPTPVATRLTSVPMGPPAASALPSDSPERPSTAVPEAAPDAAVLQEEPAAPVPASARQQPTMASPSPAELPSLHDTPTLRSSQPPTRPSHSTDQATIPAPEEKQPDNGLSAVSEIRIESIVAASPPHFRETTPQSAGTGMESSSARSTSASPPSAPTEEATMDLLRRICARFHLVARQLRLRKEYRPTVEINDEYDLQDLFYALLRLQFDEVGTEEWSPDYANGAQRTTFLLDWDRTAVIVKQTRSGLSTRDLAEQVKSDTACYSARPNGKTLFCFIYDPEGRVGNPRGLEADLATVGDTYTVEVVVAPK